MNLHTEKSQLQDISVLSRDLLLQKMNSKIWDKKIQPFLLTPYPQKDHNCTKIKNAFVKNFDLQSSGRINAIVKDVPVLIFQQKFYKKELDTIFGVKSVSKLEI